MDSLLQRLRTSGARVFVATGFRQQKLAQDLMSALKLRGHVITCDWTRPVPGMSAADKAVADHRGVVEAEVVIAVMTLKDYEYKGTWTEIGIALGAGRPVLLVTPFTKSEDATCAKNVYFWHPAITRGIVSVEDLLSRLSVSA